MKNWIAMATIAAHRIVSPMCEAMNGHSTYSPEPSAVASRITPGPRTLRSGKRLREILDRDRSEDLVRRNAYLERRWRHAKFRAELVERRPERGRERDAVALALGAGALLGLAGHQHLVVAGRRRDRLEVAEQPAEQLAGALAARKPLDVDGEVEVPDVLRALVLVQAPDAVADAGARQHAGEHLDEEGQRVALVAAERDGGGDLAGVGRGAALRVDAPALGDRAALVAR